MLTFLVVPDLVVVVFLSVAAVLLGVGPLVVVAVLPLTGVFVVAAAGLAVVRLALRVDLGGRPTFLEVATFPAVVLALVPPALVVDGSLVAFFALTGLAFWHSVHSM